MQEQFIPYKLALKLKELGFDEECLGYFNKEVILRIAGQPNVGFDHEEMCNSILNQKYCAAPLWQQAFDWFRETYNFIGDIVPFIGFDDLVQGWSVEIYNSKTSDFEYRQGFSYYENYTDARQSCLEKLIEIVFNSLSNK